MKALHRFILLQIGFLAVSLTALMASEVVQPAGSLPVAAEVDVIVIGGSSAGVTAAVKAAEHGAKVFLAAPRPYLGEDICGTYRLWLEADEKPLTPLARELFGNASPLQPVPPMQVKRALDRALLDVGVKFRYASFVTEILRDEKGEPAGVVIANKSGRQAVLGRVIIDATERAQVARMAGARFTDYPAGPQTFSRVVVGGEPRTGDGVRVLPREPALTIQAPAVIEARREAGPVRVIEYQLTLPMRDATYASFAQAEQLARDLTWSKEALDGSELLYQVPPDALLSREPQRKAWTSAEEVPLGALQSEEVPRVFVLGGCADVSREAAARLTRPVNLMALAVRVGSVAADLAKASAAPVAARVPGTALTQTVAGNVREVDEAFNVRKYDRSVPEETRALPVLGEYDVVVVGGGTGGAPAGIASGRQGAKTLMIEYQAGFGGVGTLGYIAVYYHANRVGFTAEVTDGLAEISPRENRPASGQWNPDHKSEWWRRELRKAGVEIWTGALGCGAVVDKGRVTGVVVVTPQGRGVVLAKAVVDSTGNSDIAAAAGATCRYTDGSEIAVQGTGIPPRNLGQRYLNTDWTYVDETDITDIWRAFVMAREKFKDAYDLGTFIDTRERRQILGDFTLSPMDEWLGRTYPDTVVITQSDLDSHGYTIHPIYTLRQPDRRSFSVHLPLRCLIPQGLDRILVTGLSVSAHRDALPFIRMQGDVQNQGYAVGLAAAMIAQRDCPTRELDIKALQKRLIEKGNLPPSVLTEQDSPRLAKKEIEAAVYRLPNGFEQLEIVLDNWDVAQPILREAYAQDTDEGYGQRAYAQVLGMMGDATGAANLAKAVAAKKEWDPGWRYKGMGQYGPNMSPLDSLIIALGRTRSPLALQPILEKASLLTPASELSHFRAVALALEALGDPRAAKPLADLLGLPGVSGHEVLHIQDALLPVNNPPRGTENSLRDKVLPELHLARALYRCGDYEGVAEKILRSYAADLHAHYARHAQAILKEKHHP
ncbi:MAG: hypothetical protein RL693_381 [Verrucomicrobiota bacterium]|jgi:flavin-dependent dehydrogenase